MNEFKQTWNESFKKYAVDIARIFLTNRQQIINCLALDSVCGSLNETYLSLVSEKELEPIENISQSEKERIWNLAKGLSDKKAKCILICRSIYLLEKLT